MVEAYWVLIHLLDVWLFLLASQQFVHACLGQVRVPPAAILWRHLLDWWLILKFLVCAVLGQGWLESSMLNDGVFKCSFRIQHLVHEVFKRLPLQILISLVRIRYVTNFCELRKWLWSMPVVETRDSLVGYLGWGTLDFITLCWRDWVGFLAAWNKWLFFQWSHRRTHLWIRHIEINRLLVIVFTIGRNRIALECTKAFIRLSTSSPTEAHVAHLANLVLVLTYWLNKIKRSIKSSSTYDMSCRKCFYLQLLNLMDSKTIPTDDCK